jgi:hypothetical protein
VFPGDTGIKFHFNTENEQGRNGKYSVVVHCKQDEQRIEIHPSRSVHIYMPDCANSNHVVTSVLAGLFADEHEHMQRISTLDSKNVLLLM